jgi:hypothetical protein
MKKFILTFLIVLPMYAVQAQRNYFYLSWDINKPTASTDWIGSTSSSGGKAGYRFFLNNEKISLGLDVNWGAYDEYKPTETFQTEKGAITTDYFNYIYTYAITASGQYNFTLGDGDRFFPYAGLGLGANHNEYVQYYNIYSDSDKRWGFLARPEAGMLVKVGRTWAIMGAVHYDISNNKSDYFGYKNFSAIGFQLGVAFLQR